jgi:transposase
MLGFNSSQRYYIYTRPTDMRNGFDGLSGLIRNELKSDPRSGEVYVFFNSNRDKIKILVWDRDGYVLYSKRLERGRFETIKQDKEGNKYNIRYDHLVMLLGGISLFGLRQRPRYEMGKQY